MLGTVTDDSFPRLQARTARFTLGRPRSFVVAPDERRVLFLRSRGGTDRVTCLWSYDVDARVETLLADPLLLLAADDQLPDSERARRERAREQAAGIVGYATDTAASIIAFALSGRLYVTADGSTRELPTAGAVFDPRPDPTGRRVAYVSDGRLRVVDVDGSDDRQVIGEDDVSWGAAEFVAAEEMNRQRGFWWAPDGDSLLAARVDESAVQQWYIGDPSRPGRQPAAVRYPAAGTPNAAVSLAVLDLAGGRVDVTWETDAFPYLTVVRWRQGHRPLLQVASRDQRHVQVLELDPTTGFTTVVRADHDPLWLELVSGVPDRLSDGRLVSSIDLDDTRRLVFGDDVVTPADLQVTGVVAVDADRVLVSASATPTEQHLWLVRADGTSSAVTTASGLHGGTFAGESFVISRASPDTDGVDTVVVRDGVEIGRIASYAEPAPFVPRVSLTTQGRRGLHAALVLPRDHVAGSRQLPVLMDPYGGPHAQRVVASRNAYLNAQWLADQGFAVVIVDGRGTPGRGPAWERAVAGDLAGPVLDDQVDALQAMAATNPDLDLSRVAIRGWSFGGYLAALAVLRRPDVFHVAVAGAPVTDWTLYDTYYTERYLGTDTSAASYAASSLITDAPALSRPLMIVHGLADDNVVAAHTLRLSTALLAAGRPHSVLPLSGVTHMAAQEDVAANLLMLELAFVRTSLGIA
ncbi:MAG: dipeptidyl-peptidase 4 [Actinomycetota bacterium]|nr:dipeptidyl-peptidase 4 [Actinomycetota bacterium]